MNLIRDINFSPDYLKAYEAHEGGRLETFRYGCPFGEAFVHYFRRPLDAFEGFGGYCDLITPYGYGGQMISSCELGRESELVTRFNSAFEEHCRSENAVSYFARFNPLADNGPAFHDFFDELQPVRKVVVMDLTLQSVKDNLTSKGRYSYNAAISRGVTVVPVAADDELDAFLRMYYGLMDYKQAGDYYFFSKSYFNYLIRTFPSNMLLLAARVEGRTIQYAFIIVYGDVAYCHLTCRLLGYNYYMAGNASNVVAAEYARSCGCRYFMLGGGLSADEMDSLYRFKKQFSVSDPRIFYVGKRIFDRPVYDALCARAGQNSQTRREDGFFPQYRRPSPHG